MANKEADSKGGNKVKMNRIEKFLAYIGVLTGLYGGGGIIYGLIKATLTHLAFPDVELFKFVIFMLCGFDLFLMSFIQYQDRQIDKLRELNKIQEQEG